MRRTISLGSVALAYALGLVWAVMMFAAVALLLAPLSAAYREIGIDEPLVAMACTTALAVTLATVVAGGMWLVVQRRRLAHVAGVDRG
jgi:MFS-type transporter involved in bile tolerance (Atg22 family)